MTSPSAARRSTWLHAWWPALSYMLLIWLMSSLSRPPSVEDVPFHDKGVHFLEYGLLAMLLAHARRVTRPQDLLGVSFLFAAGLATLFGLTDEIHQAFVPNRNSDVNDLMADGLGAAIGAATYLVAMKLLRRRSGG